MNDDAPTQTTAPPTLWVVRVGPIGDGKGTRLFWLGRDGKSLQTPITRARHYFNPAAAEQAAIDAKLAVFVVEGVAS
jgi:hypothetical protein